ncbi:DNA/RNA non-specific endonuclease [Levilactobacillus acidifarinae]|nr:DNA/RNA non-specific endonuclease [Levilactobacillus acidifarinae]GEO69278.1 DNA-entry nuclease [Levilactobacillus acidifarinae]
MQAKPAIWVKWLVVLTLFIGGLVTPTALTTPTVAHATTVYVTRTGKHYFFKRHDRGLNRAKKVYAVSLSTAKSRGLTLSATETAPTKRRTVKRVPKRTVTKKRTTKRATVKPKSTYTTGATTYRAKVVNHNNPGFSQTTLSTKHGAWQTYGNLDGQNRATAANALLNRKLMPKGQRQALYVNPTAWHNKRIKTGWLYNRCHLIGYQLTGQNNNPKNLITGTRQLNDPGMTTYENRVAAYLKASPKHYVRYRVTPVFKGHELLARGVKMQMQSVGSNRIRYNVYLPNTQSGMQLNYATGLSKVAG